jgi:hypothetical protein
MLFCYVVSHNCSEVYTQLLLLLYCRGPVSYDEDGEGGSGGSFEGGRGGGRGRGRGGYGRGGGNQQRERRGINPEAAAVNEAIHGSNSWRELQTILEQQVWLSVRS